MAAPCSRWIRNLSRLDSRLGILGAVARGSAPQVVPRCLCTSSHLAANKKTDRSEQIDSLVKRFSTSTNLQLRDDDETSSRDVFENINRDMTSPDLGRLFAVVQIQSVQRKVTTDDIIRFLGNFSADIGDRIRLEKVLMVGGSDFSLVGRPLLSRNVVRVEATVIEKTIEHPKLAFNYKKRANYTRFKLSRKPQAFLRINSIELNPLDQET